MQAATEHVSLSGFDVDATRGHKSEATAVGAVIYCSKAPHLYRLLLLQVLPTRHALHAPTRWRKTTAAVAARGSGVVRVSTAPQSLKCHASSLVQQAQLDCALPQKPRCATVVHSPRTLVSLRDVGFSGVCYLHASGKCL